MATSSASEIRAEIERAVRMQKPPEIKQGVDDQVDKMVNFAQAIAPELTGKYRESIHAETQPNISGLPARRIVSDDPKAPYLEYGTSDTPEFATFAKMAQRFGGDQKQGGR